MGDDKFVFCVEGVELVRDILLELGWKQHCLLDHVHLYWRAAGFTATELRSSRPWQRFNHFPGTCAISRKDNLCRSIRKMRAIYGAIFDFTPETYLIPSEYAKFARMTAELPGSNLWIFKPADLSRGRGIFLFSNLHDLKYDCPGIVQSYIPNPLTIDGYKFDLRLYVVVTSFYPLTVYVAQEGLVRLGSQKFDKARYDNLHAHLTNTAINKTAATGSSLGCKLSYSQLRANLAARKVDERRLWSDINEIVVLTMLSLAPEISSTNTTQCFELFGFDIMIDEAFKPWLIEVNVSPQLNLDTPVDYRVKGRLLKDLIGLLSFDPTDIGKVESHVSYQPRLDSTDEEEEEEEEEEEDASIRTSTRTPRRPLTTSRPSLSRIMPAPLRAESIPAPVGFTPSRLVFQYRSGSLGSRPATQQRTVFPKINSEQRSRSAITLPQLHRDGSAPRPPGSRAQRRQVASSEGSLPRGLAAPTQSGCLLRVFPFNDESASYCTSSSNNIKEIINLLKRGRRTGLSVVPPLF